ncbi:uncharacterized protein LOC113352226 [Papaver somniferum]|uniref:uncharacterized protein LOC113352226 n=1 Tax=Papaver somniferum TaxID=3469 RepID=UPI000E6FFAFE|nr:uncharacterized protein LOC113352226 [Papaver somniferum]
MEAYYSYDPRNEDQGLYGCYCASMLGHNSILEDNFRWVLIGVYGPCHVNEKKTFRTELATSHGYWNGIPLCFGGDFNEIRYMVERRGCRRASNSMKLFNDLCNELDLVELPLSGAKFTWSRPPNKKSKIDRFLFTPDWEDHFPNIIFKRLARPFSDHFPIELCSSNPDWGAFPFRFQLAWLEGTNIIPLMKKWWESFSFVGTAGDCFAKKLNALKEKLKVWNKDVFGSIDRAIDAALTKVKELDDLDDDRGLTEVEEDMLVTAKVEFEMAHRRQFIMLRQKSRIGYFRDGDRNNKHFHRVVKGHRAFNNINNLRINGRWTDNKEEIKKGIRDHFELAFKEISNNRPRIKNMCLRRIDENASVWMERAFSKVLYCSGSRMQLKIWELIVLRVRMDIL